MALSARELVRVAAGRVLRQPHDVQQVAHARRGVLAAAEAVCANRLGHDAADAVPRVQRRERVLEDHLHPAAKRAQLLLAELRDVLAVEHDPSVRRLVQPQDGAADRRLAAARLADEPDRLAAVDRQRHAVDGADVADVPVEDEAALDREVDLELVELEQRPAAVRCDRHAVAAVRARSHSSAGTGLKQAT